jgi:hypothetical protein
VNLLPYPRRLKRHSGTFVFPARSVLYLDAALPRDAVLLPIAERLQDASRAAGFELELITSFPQHPRLSIRAQQNASLPNHPAAYHLEIKPTGVFLKYRDEQGLRAGAATLRQLFREYGSRLPGLTIHDHADFPKRGVMLDVSRGRVPTLAALIELTNHLADLKINEFQLYTEHTFAYRNYEPVWRDWSPLTGEDILTLDAHCRRIGIELVPNQNSFGHLRYWLAYPPLKKLAETPEPWPDQNGAFLRHPATLAPNNSGTLPFLRGLYDELLPHFTSRRFNVGCDETWDLGRGQSKELCARKGKGRVYLDFLKKIQAECSAQKKQMLFWGDIIIHYPELVSELPKDVVALNWGYEASHPFDREAGIFENSKIPFYVCPGTSTWMSLIGRHDNAFANLRHGAEAGLKHGAIGYLNTDWGDGGHPQPLAVSYLPFLLGAAVSWCAASYDEKLLVPVANRDIFQDPSGHAAKAAHALGFAHRKFKYFAPNITPFGATIAAPPPRLRELFCRDGLKYYARVPARNIQAALDEVEAQRAVLRRARPCSSSGSALLGELDLAARMAAQSCKFMLWQQALAAGKGSAARSMARRGIAELKQIQSDFKASWPTRNKGTPPKHWQFLKWRIADYRRGTLSFPPEVAALVRPSTSAD